MKLEGDFTFDAPRDVVWKTLLDPEALSKTLPGCERLEQIGENEYRATLNIRVGPVQGKFDGTVHLSDLNPPQSYHMRVQGKGVPGFVDGEGTLHLEEQEQATLLRYDGTAKVGGRIASVGQRLLETSARALTRQSLEGLHGQVKARAEAEKAHQPPPPIDAPSQVEFATNVAKEVMTDLVPAEQRAVWIGLAVALLLLLVFVVTRPRRAS